MDKLQLFAREHVLLQQLLEVVPAQVHDGVHGEGQLNLRAGNKSHTGICYDSENVYINEGAPLVTARAKINAFYVYF